MKQFVLTLVAVCAIACSTRHASQAPSATRGGALSAAQAAAAIGGSGARLLHDVGAALHTSAQQMQVAHRLPFQRELGYQPALAHGFDKVQASALRMSDAELEVFAKRGFVISNRQHFPSFTYGYASIYAADLPVFISADSILDALHRSYDSIVLYTETDVLRAELRGLLGDLLTLLATKSASEAKSDLELYLSVPLALLDERAARALPARASALVHAAQVASGMETVKLFGAERDEDFSQFLPRGHYADTPALASYFKAMIWLGRVDFRLVEFRGDKAVLQRRAVDAMLQLDSLLDAALRLRVARFDRMLSLLVGSADAMTISQIPALFGALAVSSPAAVAKLGDATLTRVLVERGFGQQQIASQLSEGGLHAAAALDVSFGLFPQRYTLDSHTLANVTWDRTRAKRMLPDPLDVAYAVFGNDQPLPLLADSLQSYAGELQAMRILIDAHPPEFWKQNLYNDWLWALRKLSPESNAVGKPREHGLPSIAGTEAWGRRVLATQLASWAQLRHDTLLYTKQSYGSMASCEFPDVAVDPYPEFYAAIARFAEHGRELAQLLGEYKSESGLSASVREYFNQLAPVAAQLEGIARAQVTHTPLTSAQLAFINDAVYIRTENAGCTTQTVPSGWYVKIIFGGDPLEFDPTIADVHTQPTDENGNPVGRVLHVGTAWPRKLVVTFEGCDGKPRAFVGVAFSYYEHTTQNLQRLTDADWEASLNKATPAEPRWLADVVVN